MAFKTFTAGATLPASDLNTYLMQQANIICTSGTRPGSPIEGMLIYETDTDLIRRYNGTDWATKTTQSGADAYTVTAAVATNVTITFPIAFTATPNLVCTVLNTSLVRFYPLITALSTTGATVRVQQGENVSTTGSGTLQWIAYGTV